MELLANAIRDHLELKRRHGADPQEVAHLENEAFGPVHGREERYGDPFATEPDYGPDLDARFAEGGHIDLQTAPAHVGPETMEIDMRSVIGVRHVSPQLTIHDGGDDSTWHAGGSPDMGDPAADIGWEIPTRARRAS